MSRSHLVWLLASAATVVVAPPAAAQTGAWRFHFDHVLGTSLDLTVVAQDEAGALMAVTAARREIDRLERILSAWRPDSELSALNRDGAVRVSADLRAVLAQCEAWRDATGGAFDCRVGEPLARLRAHDETASAPALRQALDFRGDGVVARGAGQQLTVDGLAKGYVIDRALEAARRASPNLRGLLVDVGGDLRCWGQSPAGDGWRVGVAACGAADNAAPARQLRLSDRALAVSGRGQRDLMVDGRAQAETLDPATGRPVTAVLGAAVVAPDAACADALATAFMVMPPHLALALADHTPGVDALITAADGTEHRSAGWGDLEQPLLIRASFATSATAATAPAVAGKGLTLDIGYTVPKLEAEPYHAPYVVMWITDANRQLVRTLLVLGNKPKWAPENYVWWRRYGRLTPQVVDSVGRPTRLPGRYTVHWDGKNEAGKPMTPGKYILHIESSREKGGHTYETIELDFGAKGTKALPAKDEMGAVDLRFGPA